MTRCKRPDFDMPQSSAVVNQTSCVEIDLSSLSPLEFQQFMDEMRAAGLLEEEPNDEG